MLKRTWDFIGDVRLSFWLLLAAAGLFLAGMLHSSYDYSYFRVMNDVRIQDWLLRELPSRPGANWWLPALVLVLLLLGINTIVCTINRVTTLFTGSKRSGYLFVQSLLPSAVHLLFVAVMLGHAITVTAGSWTRIPLTPGGIVSIDPSIPALAVRSIRDAYYPAGSRLANRLRQTEVILTADRGPVLSVSYLEPVRYHGYWLQLDMIKEKKEKIIAPAVKPKIEDSEICNKAETFRSVRPKRDRGQKLFLLAIRDPGLPVILAAFTLILIIMAWYFISLTITRNGRQESSAPESRIQE